ncbi:hypothetical protein [Pseudochelatococcus sp. G4_1912]|uniref:hypothetical protein n=1 Tax=Pseudochelatococcus sp. G4_1912 TaxID=3114288 RepID=UPI0039C6ED37
MAINAPLAGIMSTSLITPSSSDADLAQEALTAERSDDTSNNAPLDTGVNDSGAGLKSLSSLFVSPLLATSTSATELTIEELGANLISFSKLSEAQALLGMAATTRFYQKIVIDNITYLQPLQEKLPKTVDLTDIAKIQPTYIPVGEPIPYIAGAIPSIDQFSAMHSADQRALLMLSGTYTNGTYSLTYKDTSSNPILTAVLSADGKTVYIVEKLDKSRFFNMPYLDQLAISKTPAFQLLKLTLGLDATKADIETEIDSRLAAINKAFQDRIPTVTVSIPGDNTAPQNLYDRVGFFTTDHLKLFTDQLEIIKQSLNTDLAVYNKAQIDDKLAAITERFERALAFGDLPVHASDINDPSAAVKLVGTPGGRSGGDNDGPTAYVNLISLDMNVTVKAGFDNFIMQEERRIAAEKEKAALIAKLNNPDPDNPLSMDGPQLLFQLQLYYNIIAEAELACISEEVRQQNDLIKSYSEAQSGLGVTMKINGDTQYLGLRKPDNITKYTAETTLAISMFQTNAGAANALAPLHPIEKLRNITRPRIDAFTAEGKANTKQLIEWSQYASQLKDSVGIIGQEIQDKSNKANGIEKEKARISQFASQVNTKMYEAIQALARMGFW